MAWRKIRLEDCRRGVVVRFSDINDSYNIGTIISFLDVKYHSIFESESVQMKVARPYAYANLSHNSNQPLIGCEIIEYNFAKDPNHFNDKGFEVFEGKDGNIRMMMT